MNSISLIHPSRGRPVKSFTTLMKWMLSSDHEYELILSLDSDDETIEQYKALYQNSEPKIIISPNKSCVSAINNAAKVANGNILVVVSDDSDCEVGWSTNLYKEVYGKFDYLLKTDDGIQDYIVTQTIMDQKYFQRDGYIYNPDFQHQFADTYLTCVADIRGRLIKSNLVFPHNHYSHLKEQPDALNKRNDDTWKEGQKTFVRLMKQFSPEERARIKDPSMRGFLKHVGL